MNKLMLSMILPVSMMSLPQGLSAQVNDECANATWLTVYPPGTCPAGSLFGTNDAATDSGSPPSCDPSTNGYHDVWFIFNTGNNTGVSITLTSITATNLNYAIYDACSGNELVCVTTPTGTQSYTAQAFATFIVQVESNLDHDVGGLFEICIEGNGIGINPPANNECTGAITLPVNQNCTTTTMNVFGATQSTWGFSCGGNTGDPDDDVWFKFVAPGPTVLVEVDGSAQFDAVVDLGGGTCSNWNYSYCASSGGVGGVALLTATGLTTGATYYGRVYDYDSGYPGTTTFTICAYLPDPPPANDQCAGAITVPMQVPCTPQTFNGNGATPGATSSACNSGAGNEDDVWFDFVATSGDVRITVDGNGTGTSGYDPVVNLVFSGNCSTFSHIACKDDTGPGGTEVLEYSGINPGGTYYVQVYDADGDEPVNTTFTLCVQDVSTGNGIHESGSALDWSLLVDGDARRIGLSSSATGTGSWQIMDAAGHLLAQGNLMLMAGSNQWVPLPNLAAGTYMVRAYVGGRIGTRRFTLF